MPGARENLKHAKSLAREAKQRGTSEIKSRIIVGTATCGVSAGARDVVETLNREITSRGLSGVVVSETGCSGRCDLEPLVQVQMEGKPPVLYSHIDSAKAQRIVQQHIVMGETIKDWTVE